MHHIVYSSTAALPLTEEALRHLLGLWRAKNTRLGVTGMLLYSEGNILQILEGEAEKLHALFAIIAADRRHRNVVKLADGPVATRAFANWSMQLRTVDAANFRHVVQQLNAAPAHTAGLAPVVEAFLAEQP